MHKYVMLCQDTDVSVKSKSDQKSSSKKLLPQSSDNQKTRISYLVSSFDSYGLNVKHRTFKHPI